MTHELKAFTFVSFDPAYRKAFFDLNKAWLEAHFLLEPYDIEVLSNPEREVLDAGGEIHFGLWGEEAIATFALTPRRKGVMELNKMAVHQNHRGKGIGHLMMNRVMDVCRLRNVQTLELYSHTSLASAIHLYHKFGFKTIPMPADCVYDRANTRMQLEL